MGGGEQPSGGNVAGGAGGAGAMSLYNPNYSYGSPTRIYGEAAAKGLQSFGSGMSGTPSTPQFQTSTSFDPFNIPESDAGAGGLIPAPQDQSLDLDAIIRLLRQFTGG